MAEPAWTVVSQVEGTGLTPAGPPAKGVTVSFRLADGTAGTVFVPDANYTPDQVRAAISAKVTNMLAIKGLTG